MKEAIGQVKAELGPEAMILHTRRLPRGPQNPYGRDVFEIEAAADGTSDAAGTTVCDGSKTAVQTQAPVMGGGPGEWRGICSELSEIKDMLLVSNQARGISQFLGLPQTCLNLYSRLLRAGISEQRAWGFMAAGGAFEKKKDIAPQQVTKDVFQAMMKAIVVADPFTGKNGARTVAAFVGPTGVGKTTTIAKLSAELSLKHKKKVGIVSVDSYRIGAVDQLKTYAAIMGLPCLSAFSKEDLSKALDKLADRDVILVDTAGQSHRDMGRLGQLRELLDGAFSIDTHLVLSAATKPEDMAAAAKNFSILKPSSYVFTKVDETGSRGGLIDQMLNLKLPVSFITNGQRVPEDIFAATRRRVLKLVLEEDAG
jgi:flagellar biosynthesis protein FlhF